MRYIILTGFLALLFASCSHTLAELTVCETGPRNINGEWDVALYFDPNAEPSSTEMTLKLTDAGELSGSFYGTPFEQAKSNTFQNEIVFTVITSDGTGEYVTTGRVDCSGIIKGQTLSRGRDFLMPWIATRKTANK